MSRIVVIGDSLAAMRPDDGYKEEERWPYLLKSELGGQMLNVARTYSTTKRLKNDLKNIQFRSDDLIVLQLGIVDCVPRRYKRWQFSLLYRLPSKLREKVLGFLNSVCKVSDKRRYVQPNDYENNIKAFVSNVSASIILIKILPMTEVLYKKKPEVGKSIKLYNEIIDDICNKFDHVKCADIGEHEVKNLTLDDGYHLNKNGHVVIKDSIVATSVPIKGS